MVTELAPLNVSPLSVVVSIVLTPAAPPVGRARDAAVMGKALPPNVLEMRMRILSAPMDTWSVCRSVASLNTPAPV